MRNFRKECLSAPDLDRTMKRTKLQIEYSKAKERARAESFEDAYQRLPEMRVKKALTKIGVTSKIQVKYRKPREQHEEVRMQRQKRYRELRRHYSRNHYADRRPFSGELDEVVLDCYKPGEKKCFSQVWKMYKQNYKNLAYRTQRVLNCKGIFCPPAQ